MTTNLENTIEISEEELKQILNSTNIIELQEIENLEVDDFLKEKEVKIQELDFEVDINE